MISSCTATFATSLILTLRPPEEEKWNDLDVFAEEDKVFGGLDSLKASLGPLVG